MAINAVVAAILELAIARAVLDSAIARMVLNTMAVMTTSHAGRTVAGIAEIATVPAIVHAKVLSVGRTEVAAMAIVVSVGAVQMPSMSASICSIEVWTSEVEEIAVRINAVDAKVPESCVPIERTVEVRGCYIGIPLPIKQYVAQVEVTTFPVSAEDVVATCYSHQIVEVYLVGSLILLVGEVQFIRHLIGEEQGFIAGLLVAHCTR